MIDDPKEKREYLDKLIIRADRERREFRFGDVRAPFNAQTLFNLAGTVLLLLLGTVAVSATVLGLIPTGWLTVFFSILGSMAVTAGIYSMYICLSRCYMFEPLINKAIRRAIQYQN